MSSLHFHAADICVCCVQVPALAQLCNNRFWLLWGICCSCWQTSDRRANLQKNVCFWIGVFFTCFFCPSCYCSRLLPSYYCSRLPFHFFSPFLHLILLLSFLHMLPLSILLLLPASSSFLSSFPSPYFTPFLSSHASSVHLIAPFFFIISFFLLLTLFYFFPLYLPYSFTPSISSHSPIFTHYSL